MDLNYLYHRQQVSIMRADRAACLASRNAHLGLARLYLETISLHRGRIAPRTPVAASEPVVARPEIERPLRQIAAPAPANSKETSDELSNH